jgi:RNA polymerase sigma-70 factor (ECF subfamily)
MGRGAKPPFVRVYGDYWDKIFGFVLKRVDDRDDAEDIVALTFLKAFLAYDQFAMGASAKSLRGWIFRIAENLIADYYRAAAKERRLIGFERAVLRGVDEQAMESEVETGETLRWALNQLRPRYRRIVILRFLEDYRYVEIADLLSWPLGTVKSSLHRAMRELGEILAEERG